MRLIKMFGLATVAAVAAMAFVGASSATATSSALCKVHGELACAAGNIYTGHVEAVALNPTLVTNITTITCELSIILGNALGLVLNGPLVAHLELVDFHGNCKTSAEVPCTVQATAVGLLLLLKTEPNKGLVSSHGTSVLVKCGLAIHCTFSPKLTEEFPALGSTLPLTEGHGEGKSLATIHANGVELERLAGICPATANWTALYEVNLPHNLAISS